MRRTLSTSLATATIALCAVLGLTACTGSAPTDSSSTQSVDQAGDDGQSVADACALVQQKIGDATDAFDSVASEDPAAVVESMKAAAAQLSDVAPSITNDQVAELVAPLQDMFEKTSEIMSAVAKGDVTKLGDLSDLGTQFQETGQNFQALCAP